MCLAAIILSTIGDTKTWSDKTLSQIEGIGKALYDDAVIDSHITQNIMELPRRVYIGQEEYLLDISDENKQHDLNAPTLTNIITNQLTNSPTLYVLMKTISFSLIEKDEIYYWYDPNGVEDAKQEIIPSVCCFSDMKLLINHILELGTTLQSLTFSADTVKCRKK